MLRSHLLFIISFTFLICSGPTNTERCRIEAAYKKAIRSAHRKPKQSSWNRLHSSFLTKNTTDFWKSWKQMYSKSQSGLHKVVNGVSSEKEIADSFKNHFIRVSQPNNQQKVDCMAENFSNIYNKTVSDHSNCSCASYSFSIENIIDATFSMQKGKCCDDSSIHAEHIFNAPLPLFYRLQHLFTGLMLHGVVPHQFQRGTIIPIVKDRQGDKGDLNNYRGITIAPVISKIFEHALRIVFQSSLTTSSYQFGFKRQSST